MRRAAPPVRLSQGLAATTRCASCLSLASWSGCWASRLHPRWQGQCRTPRRLLLPGLAAAVCAIPPGRSRQQLAAEQPMGVGGMHFSRPCTRLLLANVPGHRSRRGVSCAATRRSYAGWPSSMRGGGHPRAQGFGQAGRSHALAPGCKWKYASGAATMALFTLASLFKPCLLYLREGAITALLVATGLSGPASRSCKTALERCQRMQRLRRREQATMVSPWQTFAFQRAQTLCCPAPGSTAVAGYAISRPCRGFACLRCGLALSSVSMTLLEKC